MSQSTFTIAVSADDGRLQGGADASFPPPFASADAGSAWMRVQNSVSGGSYFYNNVLMRWDTSALTAGVTISQAVLNIYPRSTNFSNDDSRHLYGEWYTWTPAMGSGNYSTTPASTAFDVTLASLTQNAVNAITLTSPDANVNKTGYTGLRLYISGTAPAGLNQAEFSDFDNGSNIPQLVIDYSGAATNPVPEDGDAYLLAPDEDPFNSAAMASEGEVIPVSGPALPAGDAPPPEMDDTSTALSVLLQEVSDNSADGALDAASIDGQIPVSGSAMPTPPNDSLLEMLETVAESLMPDGLGEGASLWAVLAAIQSDWFPGLFQEQRYSPVFRPKAGSSGSMSTKPPAGDSAW